MDIERQFNAAYVDDFDLGHIQLVRETAMDLGHIILQYCPDSRERSLALTRLEEALMWAVKSISHNGDVNA